MSTAVQQVSTHSTGNDVFRLFQPADSHYLPDSELYRIKGGYEAEVIVDPGRKIREAGLFETAKNELGAILLAAFERQTDERETFLGGDKFTKVALDVDCLVVVRKSRIPVAFAAGTFVSPYLFYMNTLMVMPQQQTAGLGFYTSTCLWNFAIGKARQNGYQEPDVVCRTRNRKVASGFMHLLNEGKISTECCLTPYDEMILENTARYLKCKFNPTTGIIHDAYPAGLPEGNEIQDFRISEAFESLGPQDACFINGKLNIDYLGKLYKRYVTPLKLGGAVRQDLPLVPEAALA